MSRKPLNKFLKLWVPVLSVMLVITAFSHMPGSSIKLVHLFPFRNFDKYMHFLIFGFLGMNLSRAFAGQHRWFRLGDKWIYCTLLVGAVFAALDEWHQSFVPGRDPDSLDWAFDLFGVGVAIFYWKLSRLLAPSKKNLHIFRIKENRFWYRAYYLIPLLVVLLPQYYFAASPRLPSKFLDGSLLGYDALIWLLVGVFWSRFWAWEKWWALKEKEKLYVRLGLVLQMFFFATFFFVRSEVGMQVDPTIDALVAWFVSALAYVVYFSGLKMVLKRREMIHPDPHGGCKG